MGCLGLLIALTGMTQVGDDNPVLKGNIDGLERVGGLLGWSVGRPLATPFSSAGASILLLLLTTFPALVISSKIVAEVRDLLNQYRAADSDGASHSADGLGSSLIRRLPGRVRGDSERAGIPDADPDQTVLLDSYDDDRPFRSALEVGKSASRKRGNGHRKRLADRQA